MRKVCSHYILTVNNEKLKQYVVELEDGFVAKLYPLTEEVESVEWLPGAIQLKNCNNQLIAVHMFPFDLDRKSVV